MAKVSLRIYNREIESLIDQGRLDEAAAHCQHILKTFPKHLETYRLLGKAFLEAKRYDEAVDIFNRILMAVPDDFVSHVGMSIIRDEQDKLDDAIWHMERAFEAQPSNAAIQAEMQRLYGRRDGMEPPKIRMTRGALAHMYVQGELYPQAISEIRAVLANDPQRADMQVLLARAFFRAGQKADASDMCAQLLKRYPYCFDANRIMVELIPASEKGENTHVYRHRVNELDPYCAFTKDSVFNSADVPDAAVNLDRLEYKGQEVEMGRDWGTSLGIGLSTPAAPSEQPEWLRSGLAEEDAQVEAASASDLGPASAPMGGSDIPDFLRDAGWAESSRAAEESSAFEASTSEEALTPANIPDWLKDQMPSEPPAPAAGIGERPTAPPADVPDWLSGLGETATDQGASAPTELPDWLSGLGEEASAQEAAAPASSDVPDWLSGLSSERPPESTKPSSEQESDWLGGLGANASSASEPVAADLPDWLKGLDAGKPEEPSEIEEPIRATEESTPDWLASTPASQEKPTEPPEAEPVPPAPPPASIESLGASTKEQDDAIAWLEMLAAKHGAKPEELVTDPAARSEKPPEWVEQARALAEAKPAEAPVEEPKAEEERSLDETGIWLRDLAAEEPKSTVQPEEAPAVEAELPDWLKSLDTEPGQTAPTEQPAAEEQPPAQETTEPEIPVARQALPQTRPLDEAALTQLADVPDWLIGMKEEEPEEAESQKDVAAWLRGLEKEEAKPEEPVAQSPSETPAWLSGLEEEMPAPEQVSKESEIPEWLSGLEKEEEAPAAESSSGEAETPAWLSGLEKGEEAPPVEPAAAEANVPEWLSGLEKEQEAPAAESPSAEAETPAWLSGLEKSEEAPPVEPAAAEANVPEWLSDLEKEEEPPVAKPITPEAKVPEWLSGLEIEEIPAAEPRTQEAEVPEWLSELESSEALQVHEEVETPAEEALPLPAETEPPAVEAAPADLPEWLHGLDETAPEPEEQPATAQESLPAWLKTDFEEEEPHPAPVAASDWHPEAVHEEPATPKPEAEVETPAPEAVPSLAEAPIQPPPPDVRKPARPAPETGKPARVKQAETVQSTALVLSQAQAALGRGDIPGSLAQYNKLIRKGKHLEEAIRDLRDSLYRYPVEVGIWQALGDAYMRANRLQEALDAYNKAEELLR